MDSSSETTPFFKDILIELRNIGGVMAIGRLLLKNSWQEKAKSEEFWHLVDVISIEGIYYFFFIFKLYSYLRR